jgi:hypothetical protein
LIGPVLVTSEVTIGGDHDVRGSLALLRILPVRPERRARNAAGRSCRSATAMATAAATTS